MRKSLLTILSVLFAISPAFSQTRFIREGDLWYFFRGREAPPANWAAPDFDPSAAGWEQGPTGIGYGDDDDATVLSDMQGGYWSAFLRIQITVPEEIAGSQWSVRVRYDDGFVLYVDGMAVLQRNLTGDPPAFDEPAASHEISGPQGFDETVFLPAGPTLLTPGLHILAAEVHNATIDSTDLSFSLELDANPFLVTAVEPAFGQIEGGNTVTIRGSGFNPTEPPQVLFGGVPSAQVTVRSQAELEAKVPPGTSTGVVDVEVKDSRGSVILPGAYRYIGASVTGLTFDGGDAASAGPFPDAIAGGTMEIWFRPAEGSMDSWRTLVSFERTGGGDAVRIDVRGNRLRARTWNGTTLQDLTATVELVANTWYHVALVFSSAGRKLYFNAAQVGTDELSTTVSPGMRFRLGAPFTGLFARPFIGGVESVCLWAAELSSEEIRRRMFMKPDEPTGLIAAWALDEGSGQTSADAGPGRHSLVLGDSEAAEGNDPQWAFFEDFPAFAAIQIWPTSGPLSGGQTVHIAGNGFSSAQPPEVIFGETPAPLVDVLNPWELEVMVPAGDGYGPVSVTVRSPQGTAEIPGGYTYTPANLSSMVLEGDSWNYFLGVAAPPADWKEKDFDAEAAGWPAGPSGLGFGDDDDATPLPQMEGVTIALFARIGFIAPAAGAAIDYLRLRVRYDDGFVAYLNGREIARRNVAGDPPAFDEIASALHEITGGTGRFDEEIDIIGSKGYVEKGLNVLAVEVHNATLDSTDLSISLELVYSIVPGASFRRGDVDRSGSRSITDAIWILRYLFAAGTLPCREAADANDDGLLDLTDAVTLLEYLFLAGPRLPEPFAEPQLDTDGDPLDCQG